MSEPRFVVVERVVRSKTTGEFRFRNYYVHDTIENRTMTSSAWGTREGAQERCDHLAKFDWK